MEMEMEITLMVMVMEMVALEKMKRSYLLKKERAMAKIQTATMAIPRKGMEGLVVVQEKRMERTKREKMVMAITTMTIMMRKITKRKKMRMKEEMRKRERKTL